jgi:2-iminobutanoate/2-iminopropanoate deaminase
MTIVSVPQLPPANSTYSQAVVTGGLVFVSGQLGIDPATGQLAQGGIQAETRQALENIRACLQAAGSSMERVIKATLFLTDFSMIRSANEIYAQYLPHRPAKTGVGVAELWGGGLIEIEVVATVGPAGNA